MTSNQEILNLAHDDCDPSLAWKRDGKSYDRGHDQILPSTARYTCHPDGVVKISRLGCGYFSEMVPVSVPQLLKSAVEKAPNVTALAVKTSGDDDHWKTWTYNEYLKDVQTAAKAFIALGLEPYHSVCILSCSAPEWFISDLAAIHAGGFAAGIYTTSSANTCTFVIKDSRAQIIVVEDALQLTKVLPLKDILPSVKAIIQYTGEPSESTVYSWEKLMLLGQQQSDDILNERLKYVAINHCCTLVYTAGTTGNPKGVMLSHDNLTWAARVHCQLLSMKEADERHVSFLPLSHIATQVYDLYCSMANCSTVYFVRKYTSKGNQIATMKSIKATTFLVVPQVWEKYYEVLWGVEKLASWYKKLVVGWAKEKGLEYNMRRMAASENADSLDFRIADVALLSKIRDVLGLNQCRIQISSGAPLDPGILRYFLSLNIVVTQVYGMSECSGAHTIGLEPHVRHESVGKTIQGASTKLMNEDAQGNGEIYVGGRHIAMGYLNRPEMTSNAFDEDGWFRSGDIGKMDKDGYLYIAGRMGQLFVTAEGEMVSPVSIELGIKTALPVVSHALVVGGGSRFLSALITLKTEYDEKRENPSDDLLPMAKSWINKKGRCQVSTVQDVLKELYEKKNSRLISAFEKGIEKANIKGQVIEKWAVYPVDFSILGEEIGPTLQLRRAAVLEKYKPVIEQLYL